MKIKLPLKMLKVVATGTPMIKVYPHATWFKTIKYGFARTVRTILILTFITGAGYGVFTAGKTSVIPTYVQAEDKSSQMYQDKIESLKDAVMTKLSQCEGAGYKESDGIIIFDTNNKASIGLFQWQVASVKHYYKLMTGKDITSKEAVILALNNDEAKKLAKYVAFETKNKIGRDWVNCNNKFNLDAQVDLIKQME